KKAEHVVLLRLVGEHEKTAKRDLMEIFAWAVFHPQFMGHLVNLDALPSEHFDKTCDRLGIRLAGHDHKSLRHAAVEHQITLSELEEILKVMSPELRGHLQQRTRCRDLDLIDVTRT